MKQNEGTIDRVIRVVAGLALLGFAFMLGFAGWGIVLAILGVILVLTGAIGFCPLYVPLKISTKK